MNEIVMLKLLEFETLFFKDEKVSSLNKRGLQSFAKV